MVFSPKASRFRARRKKLDFQMDEGGGDLVKFLSMFDTCKIFRDDFDVTVFGL